MPVCICPLAKPVPVCIYRDPNTKGKLSAKYQFCAIHTADTIITDGKVRMIRRIFRDCSPSVRTALCRPPTRQQSAPQSADLPMADKFADNNIA